MIHLIGIRYFSSQGNQPLKNYLRNLLLVLLILLESLFILSICVVFDQYFKWQIYFRKWFIGVYHFFIRQYEYHFFYQHLCTFLRKTLSIYIYDLFLKVFLHHSNLFYHYNTSKTIIFVCGNND